MFLWFLATGLFVIVTLLYYRKRRHEIRKTIYKEATRIDGKVVLITGGSSGFGKVAATELAKRGGKVYIAANDLEGFEEIIREIKVESKSDQVFFMYLNLGSIQSVRQFVTKFQAREEKLDILICNAGLICNNKMYSDDGFDLHYGVNYLGHFALTFLLLKNLIKSSPSRIILVSSSLHRFVKLSRECWTTLRYRMLYWMFFGHIWFYAQSKLMVMLFAHELHKRLRGTKVTVNTLHPGLSITNIVKCYNKLVKFIYKYSFVNLWMRTPYEGAQSQIRLAVDPKLELVSGKYFEESEIVECSESAKDDKDAEWLWIKSLEFTDLSDYFRDLEKELLFNKKIE